MKRRAFTLVELLCVSALVGILSFVLISFIKKALLTQSSAESHMRAQHAAARAFHWISRDIESMLDSRDLEDVIRRDASGNIYLSFHRWSEDSGEREQLPIDCVVYHIIDKNESNKGFDLCRSRRSFMNDSELLDDSHFDPNALEGSPWQTVKVWSTTPGEQLRLSGIYPVVNDLGHNAVRLTILYTKEQGHERSFTKTLAPIVRTVQHSGP